MSIQIAHQNISVLLLLFFLAGKETDRQTETETERQRQTGRDRERKRERERERERERRVDVFSYISYP